MYLVLGPLFMAAMQVAAATNSCEDNSACSTNSRDANSHRSLILRHVVRHVSNESLDESPPVPKVSNMSLPARQASSVSPPAPQASDARVNGSPHRLAVVSSHYGEKKANFKPIELPTPPAGVKCVFYTDDDSKVQNKIGWLVVTRPYHTEAAQLWPDTDIHRRFSWSNITNANEKVQAVMAAKFYKMNMYLLPELAGISTILWVDADRFVPFSDTFVANAESLLGDYDMVVQKHPKRTSVYEEGYFAGLRAYEHTQWPRVHEEIYEAYTQEVARGFEDKIGLFDCGAFLFSMTRPRTRTAFESWWKEVQMYTFRDQISFPYVLQGVKVSFSAPCLGNCLMKLLNDVE